MAEEFKLGSEFEVDVFDEKVFEEKDYEYARKIMDQFKQNFPIGAHQNIQTISTIRDYCIKYQIPENTEIYKSPSVFSLIRDSREHIEKGKRDKTRVYLSESKIVLVLAWWQRFFPTDVLNRKAKVSDQAAKPAQELRDNFGFGFYQPKKCSKNQCVVRSDGTFRKIIEFNPKNAGQRYWKRISDKDEIRFKEAMKDHLLGGVPKESAVIDHRMPEEVRKKLELEPIMLTRESLISGSCHDDFQILHTTTNYFKREACRKCQRGEEIPLPDVVETPKAYKRVFDGDCLGCFWYDPLDPLNPEYMDKGYLKLKQHDANERRKKLAAKIDPHNPYEMKNFYLAGKG